MLRKLATRFLNFSVPARIRHNSYRIPIWGGMETPGVSDSWRVELYQRLIPMREGAFIDVGMNLGQTLLEVQAASPGHRYIGFEPNAMCVAYLQRLIQSNSFSRVTVVPTGLSNQEGVRRLYFAPGDFADSGATMIAGLRPATSGYPSSIVVVWPLDGLTEELQLQPTAFIKIDTEGHELEVFEGMLETMKASRPIALIEVLPRAGGTTPPDTARRKKRLEQLARTLDYVVMRVVPEGPAPGDIHLEYPTAFLNLPFLPAESYDFLFVPEELSRAVRDVLSS